MRDGRHRLLMLCTHPVQYAASTFRQMAQHARLDLLVAYCTLRGAQAGMDPGFGVEVAWDVPLLEGYRWIEIGNGGNASAGAGPARFFNAKLWNLVRTGDYDAVYLSGYHFPEAWTAICAARRGGVPIIMSTDAHNLATRAAPSKFRQTCKALLLRRIFALADIVLAGSSGSIAYLRALGVPDARITLTRMVVDNAWWLSCAQSANREIVRDSWKIPANAAVVVFCAKLQEWKRPQDVLRAFAQAGVAGSYLVFAGDGPLRDAIVREAHELGISERVRLLGFVNQSRLPDVYAASDLLVLPSSYEPFGLVVNEAMLCGCAVVVSDQVGARFDLVREGETGCVYPCGNAPALASILRTLLSDRECVRRMGCAAREHMRNWTPEQNVEAFADALEELGKARLARAAEKRS